MKCEMGKFPSGIIFILFLSVCSQVDDVSGLDDNHVTDKMPKGGELKDVAKSKAVRNEPLHPSTVSSIINRISAKYESRHTVTLKSEVSIISVKEDLRKLESRRSSLNLSQHKLKGSSFTAKSSSTLTVPSISSSSFMSNKKTDILHVSSIPHVASSSSRNTLLIPDADTSIVNLLRKSQINSELKTQTVNTLTILAPHATDNMPSGFQTTLNFEPKSRTLTQFIKSSVYTEQSLESLLYTIPSMQGLAPTRQPTGSQASSKQHLVLNSTIVDVEKKTGRIILSSSSIKYLKPTTSQIFPRLSTHFSVPSKLTNSELPSVEQTNLSSVQPSYSLGVNETLSTAVASTRTKLIKSSDIVKNSKKVETISSAAPSLKNSESTTTIKRDLVVDKSAVSNSSALLPSKQDGTSTIIETNGIIPSKSTPINEQTKASELAVKNTSSISVSLKVNATKTFSSSSTLPVFSQKDTILKNTLTKIHLPYVTTSLPDQDMIASLEVDASKSASSPVIPSSTTNITNPSSSWKTAIFSQRIAKFSENVSLASSITSTPPVNNASSSHNTPSVTRKGEVSNSLLLVPTAVQVNATVVKTMEISSIFSTADEQDYVVSSIAPNVTLIKSTTLIPGTSYAVDEASSISMANSSIDLNKEKTIALKPTGKPSTVFYTASSFIDSITRTSKMGQPTWKQTSIISSVNTGNYTTKAKLSLESSTQRESSLSSVKSSVYQRTMTSRVERPTGKSSTIAVIRSSIHPTTSMSRVKHSTEGNTSIFTPTKPSIDLSTSSPRIEQSTGKQSSILPSATPSVYSTRRTEYSIGKQSSILSFARPSVFSTRRTEYSTGKQSSILPSVRPSVHSTRRTEYSIGKQSSILPSARPSIHSAKSLSKTEHFTRKQSSMITSVRPSILPVQSSSRREHSTGKQTSSFKLVRSSIYATARSSRSKHPTGKPSSTISPSKSMIHPKPVTSSVPQPTGKQTSIPSAKTTYTTTQSPSQKVSTTSKPSRKPTKFYSTSTKMQTTGKPVTKFPSSKKSTSMMKTTVQPFIGKPVVFTKVLANFPSAIKLEFHVQFDGIKRTNKLQIVAQKYDLSFTGDSDRLHTWYEVHYFEDFKHHAYVSKEFTKPKLTTRVFFNVTIGTDKRCPQKQASLYCNGPLERGSYRFRLIYHVDGEVRKSKFSKIFPTAASKPTTPIQTTGINQNDVTIAVIAVLAVLLVIIIIVAVLLYRKKSRPVHVNDFIPWVTRSQADSDFRFAEEFESIRDVGRDQAHEASDMPENRGKNRYTNVLAHDKTRVKLSYTDDEAGSDYINANYVHGYRHPRAYIATQGPLPGTTDDFWRMIWEQNTYNIVMVTQLMERSRVKCHEYWPGTQPTVYGEITVSLLSEFSYPEWIEREFFLECEDEGNRTVKHLQYTAWPDHGVPKTTSNVLEFLQSIRSNVFQEHGPLVIHCSAGVGRTGTLIAIDTLINRLQEEDTVDVYLTVCLMRMQRCHMVQTEDQYIFIHRAVVEYLKNQNDISHFKGYALLPKDEQNERIRTSFDHLAPTSDLVAANRDSGLALLLGEFETEHAKDALESIA